MAETSKKPDLPESTLQIMERMVKTPPKPKPKAGSDKPKEQKPDEPRKPGRLRKDRG
jgi:hypothetical protein